MCPITGTGTFNGIGNTDMPAGFSKNQSIFPPTRLVEICSEKPTCFILQYGIDTDDMTSLEMVQNCVGGYRQETFIGALATFDPRLFANPANPFVGAGRRVAFLAGFLVLPKPGIHIVSASEETEKKGDLIIWSKDRSGGNLMSGNAIWTV